MESKKLTEAAFPHTVVQHGVNRVALLFVCFLFLSALFSTQMKAEGINYEEVKMNGILTMVAADDFDHFRGTCVDGEHPPMSKDAFEELHRRLYSRLSGGFVVHLLGVLQRPDNRKWWIYGLSFEDTIVMNGTSNKTGELLITAEFKGNKLNEFVVRE